VFFYPPLGYAYVMWRTKSSHEDVYDNEDGSEAGFAASERAPLLPQERGWSAG
jgi:hypothetical protein